MDSSAFDKAFRGLARLESSSDSLAAWLFWCTLLVVVGLVVEYRHDFVELLKKRPLDKKLLQTIVGGVLITVGVAGELIVQYKASGIDAKLRSTSHLIEAGLIKSASDSAERAKGFEREIALSNSAAARANERAANAAKQAADAEEKAGKANQRAAVLEKDAAVQRERAAVAERALLELKLKLQPRHLTEEQRSIIKDGLKSVPPGLITVICAGGDPEPCAFADEFVDLLIRSGWRVTKEPLLQGVNPVGVVILVRSAETPRAGGLQRVLKAAEIDVAGKIGLFPEDNPEHDIQLFIGLKP